MATVSPSYEPPAFVNASPPPRRASLHPAPTHRDLERTARAAIPASSSDGALSLKPSVPIVPPPPSQPKRVRPFILRSTSPNPASQGPSSLPRSSTLSSGPLPTTTTTVRPRPKSRNGPETASSATICTSTTRQRPSPPPSPTRYRREGPQRPTSHLPAPFDPREVEQIKKKMKREVLLTRQKVLGEKGGRESVEKRQQGLGGAATKDVGENVDATATEKGDKKERGGRLPSLGCRTNAPERRTPSPPSNDEPPSSPVRPTADPNATITLPGVRSPRSPTKRAVPKALTTPTRRLVSAAPLRTPGNASRTHSRERKDQYRELSRSKSLDKRPTSRSGPGEAAYASMQDMLESSGFTDTRVVTPTSTVRTRVIPTTAMPIPLGLPHPLASSFHNSPTLTLSDTFGSPSSLHPPLSSRHKASMLSLRGLFSLWRSEETPHTVDDSAIPPLDDGDQESDAGSDDTITHERKARFISHTQSWVDQVAREIPNIAPTPISFPPHPTTISISPPHITPRKSSAPTTATHRVSPTTSNHTKQPSQHALRTLRHVASDPSMHHAQRGNSISFITQLTGGGNTGYQSFSVGFDGADGQRREYDDVDSQSDGSSMLLGTSLPTTVATTTAAGSAGLSSYWPDLSIATLRHRASQVLGIGGGTSPVATEEGEEVVLDARPQVIRKAVSSVALRPHLTSPLDEVKFDWEELERTAGRWT